MNRRITAVLSALLFTSALAGCGGTAEPDAEQVACDRNCLLDVSRNYVASLAAQSTEGLPLATDLKVVENLKPTQVGEGLWQDTTAGPTQFSIFVPDEEQQSAGWLGMIERAGKPTIVAVRLQLDGEGRIAEAEHLYAEISQEDQLANLQTVRPGLLADVPEANRLPRAELVRLGDSYYDALDDNNGSATPFAEDCERRENGMITAGPGPRVGPGPNNNTAPIARDCAGQLDSNVMAYITSIENRRVFAADPQTGLVMGLSHFRHPMDFEPYEVTALDGSKIMYDQDRFSFGPFDLPAAHIYKIGADGRMHEIEAMGFMTDFNSPTGWEQGGGG